MLAVLYITSNILENKSYGPGWRQTLHIPYLYATLNKACTTHTVTVCAVQCVWCK